VKTGTVNTLIMKRLILALIIIITGNDLSAQILKGTIRESTGEPLPYATVYIRELQQGTTSNTKGNYEIRLPEGKYSVIYQSLGFAPDIREVTLGKNIVNLDVVLQTQYYEIPEVRITATGEDPAYSIMRKAIGIAPYYLNQVSHYKAEVYLKGNLVINRIPKIIQKTMKMEARNQSGDGLSSTVMKEGDSYLMESVNELEFNAPDKYVQKVISYNSTFPEEGNEISPMDFIQASFYQPVIADMAISPLSPAAFSHYNFKYLGASPQGNFLINKIQVIPKRKSQQLFAGIIYIIEDLWCLHSVDLVNENIAGKIRVQQLYIPVQENIWMPVSHKFEMNINIIGFKADAGYGSSIKYIEVIPNLNLRKPEIIITDNRRYIPQKTDTAITKTRKQIEKILSKDELNNRDMVKLSSLMEKESKESLKDSANNELEIKENVTHIIEKDANKKDSSYWAGIRPIPLSETESRSIRVGDSIKAKLVVKETKPDTSGVKKEDKSKFFGTLKEIGLGHTYTDTLGFRFVNGGLTRLKNLGFNTVDGFTYGINFRVSKSWKDGKSISIYPDFKWAFSREQLMWRVNTQFRFDRMDQSQIFLRAGQTSKDFNNNGGVNVFLNAMSSLLLKKNYLKLYGSNYLTIGYRTEITNGLYAEINSTYDYRRTLSNTTDFSIFYKSEDYSENIPGNRYLEDPADAALLLRDQQHVDISAIITYTPRQKYRVNNNVKIPMGSDWPTFTLTWKHGINEMSEFSQPWKNYDMVRFEASKSSNLGAFGEYFWTIRSGAIMNKSNVSFYDFFHFSSQELPLLLSSYRDAFMLPGYYALSTPEYFTEVHAKYTTPYLLLKLLPVLSNTLMRENISFSLLYSHYQKCYTEIGYSMSEIFLLGELGVYAGFDNFSFKSIGGKLVLRFN
jgi:hypothetical protein